MPNEDDLEKAPARTEPVTSTPKVASGADTETYRSRPGNGVSLRKPVEYQRDGAFDGSFAGIARSKTEFDVKPWYLRKTYFTEGWTNASIWRAAVSGLEVHSS
jgi:hypothetical protein